MQEKEVLCAHLVLPPPLALLFFLFFILARSVTIDWKGGDTGHRNRNRHRLTGTGTETEPLLPRLLPGSWNLFVSFCLSLGLPPSLLPLPSPPLLHATWHNMLPCLMPDVWELCLKKNLLFYLLFAVSFPGNRCRDLSVSVSLSLSLSFSLWCRNNSGCHLFGCHALRPL